MRASRGTYHPTASASSRARSSSATSTTSARRSSPSRSSQNAETSSGRRAAPSRRARSAARSRPGARRTPGHARRRARARRGRLRRAARRVRVCGGMVHAELAGSRPARRKDTGAPRALDRLLTELVDFLRIPSISSGGGEPPTSCARPAWAASAIDAAGGTAGSSRAPATRWPWASFAQQDDAPTVLIYGHYDVQSANPIAAWTSPPFEPRFATGASTRAARATTRATSCRCMHVACQLARAGDLPVHVRVLMEGEEEIGGHHVLDWVASRRARRRRRHGVRRRHGSTSARRRSRWSARHRADRRRCAHGAARPPLGHVRRQRSERDARAHADAAEAVLPGPDGLLRPELREGIVRRTAGELEAVGDAPRRRAPRSSRSAAGLHHEGAARDYFRNNWADASLDVNGIEGGDAEQVRTIIPATASAKLSIRLAPGQRSEGGGQALERLLREAAPAAAEVEFTLHGLGRAGPFDPATPALLISAARRSSGHRHAARAGPRRRLDRARSPRSPSKGIPVPAERIRAARRRHPRPRRELPARVAGTRRASRPRVVRGVREAVGAWLDGCQAPCRFAGGMTGTVFLWCQPSAEGGAWHHQA